MNPRSLKGMIFLLVLVLSCTACGSKVQGTYSNENGAVMLEVKSGDQATLTIAGEARACTYKVDGNQLAVDCQGEKVAFTIHDDGSLTGPPDSFVGVLRKTKS